MVDQYIADRNKTHDERTVTDARYAVRSGAAVSWGAIFAGAAGAAALSLILLILGVGLGLSSVSPWAQAGVTAETFGLSTVIWITFTQLAASGIGGYLAGRLRKKWSDVHTDEVYFRDTAHGFLAWSLATLSTAALLASAIGSIVGGGAHLGASVAGTAASSAAMATAGMSSEAGGSMGSTNSSGSSYAIDALFRSDTTGMSSAGPTGGTSPAVQGTSMQAEQRMQPAPPVAEIGRIFANGLVAGGPLPTEDLKYIGQVVAQRTGINQQEAEKRVTLAFGKLQAKAKEVADKAKEAADKARKASAYAALWLFVSLLLGAFFASVMATLGGRQRDL